MKSLTSHAHEVEIEAKTEHHEMAIEHKSMKERVEYLEAHFSTSKEAMVGDFKKVMQDKIAEWKAFKEALDEETKLKERIIDSQQNLLKRESAKLRMADAIISIPTLNQEFHRRLKETDQQEDFEIRLQIIEQVYRARKTIILDKEKGGMDELTYWQQRSQAMYEELLRIQQEFGVQSMFINKRRSNPLNKQLNNYPPSPQRGKEKISINTG